MTPRKKSRHATSVLVVGAGFAGVTAALQLQKRGYVVTVLEVVHLHSALHSATS